MALLDNTMCVLAKSKTSLWKHFVALKLFVFSSQLAVTSPSWFDVSAGAQYLDPTFSVTVGHSLFM